MTRKVDQNIVSHERIELDWITSADIRYNFSYTVDPKSEKVNLRGMN